MPETEMLSVMGTMRLVHGLPSTPPGGPVAVTLGTFDGMHRGHQKIFSTLTREATRLNGSAVVLTFDPHPRSVLSSDADQPFLLTTIEERMTEFAKHGTDLCYVVPFTRDFASLPAERFVEEILFSALDARSIVIGEDHTFGAGRRGTADLLASLAATRSISVSVVEDLVEDGQRISSSRIRHAIAEGAVGEAHRMLGRPFLLSGTVVTGDGRGRELGFPTANLSVPEPSKVLPADGVYAVWVDLAGQRHPAMMNIGHRPTIGTNLARTIEIHVIGLDADLYDHSIAVSVIERLRDERRFDDQRALIQQLVQDRSQTLECLNNQSIQ